MNIEFFQGISSWLQSAWTRGKRKQKQSDDYYDLIAPRRLNSRHTYILGNIDGKKSDLLTDMHVLDNRLQSMRTTDRQARAKWNPNVYEQPYDGQGEAHSDARLGHYQNVLGSSNIAKRRPH